MPGLRGAALRLHLLTGRQRIAQLVALLLSDIAKVTITIFDGKGPGSEPRPHLLPLIPAARKALDEALSGGTFALSTDGGETHIHAITLLKWAQEVVHDTIPGFTSKRIRSDVETLLSKYGVTKDIRVAATVARYRWRTGSSLRWPRLSAGEKEGSFVVVQRFGAEEGQGNVVA